MVQSTRGVEWCRVQGKENGAEYKGRRMVHLRAVRAIRNHHRQLSGASVRDTEVVPWVDQSVDEDDVRGGNALTTKEIVRDNNA